MQDVQLSVNTSATVSSDAWLHLNTAQQARQLEHFVYGVNLSESGASAAGCVGRGKSRFQFST